MKNKIEAPAREVSPLKSFRFALSDIPNILGLVYLFAIGIGMLFTYQKFSRFGINIFDYADVFDFLIAPFADFTILAFTLGSFAIVYGLFLLDYWWSSRYPKSYTRVSFGMNNRRWYQLCRYLMFLALVIFYLCQSSDLYGSISEEKIKTQPKTSLRFSDNETKHGVIIGKTKEILFFIEDAHVTAIPITSLVKEFEIKR